MTQPGRPTAVILDDRAVIAVAGEDARSFLQGLISNDIDKVTPRSAIYAALLSPQGKYLHDFMVAETARGLVVDCESARIDDLIRRLTLYRLRAKVAIGRPVDDLAVVAMFGGDINARLGLESGPGQAGPFGDGVAFVDPRLAALGARAIVPRAGIGALLESIGCAIGTAGDWQRHRLALGVPDGSRDILIDKSFALEANLDALNAVDFNKGCYVGQENTTRQKRRGVLRKRLLPVAVEGPLPMPGTPIMLADKEAGRICSGLDGQAIALLRLEFVEQARLENRSLVAGDARIRPRPPSWAVD